MFRTLAAGALALVCFTAAGSVAWAQESLLGEIYGRGVHAFNGGDFAKAHELFSEVIGQGTKDPRAYYFRGVVLGKMGRSDEAEADFRQGASLEAQVDERAAVIGRSLERVQGAERVKLEEFRRVARLELMKREADRKRRRYEAFQETQKRVAQELPAGNAPATALVPVPKGDGSDPFSEGPDQAAPAPERAAAAVAPAAGAADDVFAGNPAAGEPPAAAAAGGTTDDVFGSPPAEEMKRDEAPAAGDPFGNAAPAGDAAPAAGEAADPFGNAAPAAPVGEVPAEEMKKDDVAAPGAADPFGNAAPDNAAPAPAPAGEAADPFGNAAPAGDAAAPAPAAGGPKKGSVFGALFGAGAKAAGAAVGPIGNAVQQGASMLPGAGGAGPPGGLPPGGLPPGELPPGVGVPPGLNGLPENAPAPGAGAAPAAGDPFADDAVQPKGALPAVPKPDAAPAEDAFK